MFFASSNLSLNPKIDDVATSPPNKCAIESALTSAFANNSRAFSFASTSVLISLLASTALSFNAIASLFVVGRPSSF